MASSAFMYLCLLFCVILWFSEKGKDGPTQPVAQRKVPVDIHPPAGGVGRRYSPVLPPQPVYTQRLLYTRTVYTVFSSKICSKTALPVYGVGVLVAVRIENGNDVPVHIAQHLVTPARNSQNKFWNPIFYHLYIDTRTVGWSDFLAENNCVLDKLCQQSILRHQFKSFIF